MDRLSAMVHEGDVAAARGRDIALVELTEEQAVARWRAAGRPEDVIGFLLEAYRRTRGLLRRPMIPE
ncbi:hypothetical protein RKD49_000425 [Streptomyces glaucescens]